MLENVINAKWNREGLRAARKLMFKQFLKNPLDTRMALKIKTLDDQIAECDRQMKQTSASILRTPRRFPHKQRGHGPSRAIPPSG
jgi:hypothetical protein